MNKIEVFADSSTYPLYFSNDWSVLSDEISKHAVIIIDDNVHSLYQDKLNLDDIERIEIFKGQKALQKVGEKGKNGVIIIKMKN